MRFWVPLIFLTFALGIYARWIEPNWVEITRFSFRTERAQSIKLAHLTDLHIRSMGRREARVISNLENEKPDTIAITGDSVADWETRFSTSVVFADLSFRSFRLAVEDWRLKHRSADATI